MLSTSVVSHISDSELPFLNAYYLLIFSLLKSYGDKRIRLSINLTCPTLKVSLKRSRSIVVSIRARSLTWSHISLWLATPYLISQYRPTCVLSSYAVPSACNSDGAYGKTLWGLLAWLFPVRIWGPEKASQSFVSMIEVMIQVSSVCCFSVVFISHLHTITVISAFCTIPKAFTSLSHQCNLYQSKITYPSIKQHDLEHIIFQSCSLFGCTAFIGTWSTRSL